MTSPKCAGGNSKIARPTSRANFAAMTLHLLLLPALPCTLLRATLNKQHSRVLGQLSSRKMNGKRARVVRAQVTSWRQNDASDDILTLKWRQITSACYLETENEYPLISRILLLANSHEIRISTSRRIYADRRVNERCAQLLQWLQGWSRSSPLNALQRPCPVSALVRYRKYR